MKRSLLALAAILLNVGVVLADEVKVEAHLTTGPDDPATTVFPADTPKLYAIFKTTGAKTGDKIRGVWIADDVGDVAPKGYKIDERTFDAEGDTSDGEFTLEKSNGWPVGKYHIDIYVNDKLAATAKFNIIPLKPRNSDDKKTTPGE